LIPSFSPRDRKVLGLTASNFAAPRLREFLERLSHDVISDQVAQHRNYSDESAKKHARFPAPKNAQDCSVFLLSVRSGDWMRWFPYVPDELCDLGSPPNV
jgi:hypothetical protein